MTRPTARVIREATMHEIFSYELVPGDLVLLEAGDIISADGRMIESHELFIDEAALTGESAPVLKTIDPLNDSSLVVVDRTNMAFRGTTVVGGRRTFLVTQTGVPQS